MLMLYATGQYAGAGTGEPDPGEAPSVPVTAPLLDARPHPARTLETKIVADAMQGWYES